MVNQNGVETRLEDDFGKCKIETSKIIDNFFNRRSCKDMVTLLNETGYPIEEIYTANYDFRHIGGFIAIIFSDSREMTKFFSQLDELITEITRLNSKIILVSVGTGGPLVSHYLKARSQYWKRTHLDSWYSIDGPFGGSFIMHLSNIVSSNYFWPFYLSKTRLHEFLSTLPISYFLLPSSAVFKEEVNQY
ncbi:Lecithin-cholesterol acyltransferase-like 1 [Thelohanellus kitauei]|uniref:Lecithin-cholesterol acyltransferase-like 1 n=1 Tax=Thelohanellus kitauei TaxID=669202 RepID=A0A0C2M0X0_THEKT|nr:Lecithin-cholesterol acyltransferase-like 1 [Thelohanellus kitauei]